MFVLKLAASFIPFTQTSHWAGVRVGERPIWPGPHLRCCSYSSPFWGSLLSAGPLCRGAPAIFTIYLFRDFLESLTFNILHLVLMNYLQSIKHLNCFVSCITHRVSQSQPFYSTRHSSVSVFLIQKANKWKCHRSSL